MQSCLLSDTDRAIALGLSHTRLSSRVLRRLVEQLGSVHAVWEASESALTPLMRADSLTKFLSARKTLDPDRLCEAYNAAHINVLSVFDPAYPTDLKHSHDPPFVLYVRGSLTALGPRALAIVGTRQYSDYGRKAVSTLIEQLAPMRPCIVSGLAAGIDTLAHQAALNHKLPTIAVFGTGIDRIFPRENERLALQILEAGHALVSELPMGTPGDKYTFPKRNRIIAGLSQGTLVIEGSIKSGSLITARMALEEGRQVMAVPGSIFSPSALGPHHLIQEGATPIQSANDICQAMGWDQTSGGQLKTTVMKDAKALPPMSASEEAVYTVLGMDPLGVDYVQSQCSMLSVMEVQTALTMLELSGLVTALPGARFCRNDG